MNPRFHRAARLEGFRPYRPRKTAATPVHKVDANEAGASAENLARYVASLPPEALNRYTRPHALEHDLAAYFGVAPDRVVVTAGADDGLLRLCLLTLEPGRRALMTRPTFEMIPRYVALAGGVTTVVEWFDGPVPTEDLVGAVGPETSIAFLVTPSSPSGEAADLATVERLAEACARVGALLVVDHAYVEFADTDLTSAALALPNTLVARTFSKAWGLAGLRVGYFLGPPEVIDWMKTIGQPYAVATPSVAMARATLAAGVDAMRARVARVRDERARLTEALAALGANPIRSQGNFVLARLGPHGDAFTNAMAQHGVGVRLFEGPEPIVGSVRITCPGDPAAFDALLRALSLAMDEVRS